MPKVVKTARSLVAPCSVTPSGTLTLSTIDQQPALRCMSDLIQVYKQGGREAAKIIRGALSTVLVPYYPMAGTLMESKEEVGSRMVLSCTGQGAWFIEASADCSLQDVNYMERPHLIPKEDLLPYTRPNINPDDTIFMMQVTEFTCGGLTVCSRLNHVIADGIGSAQFLGAICDIVTTRRLSIKPIWCRHIIPGPPSLPQGPPPIINSFILEYWTFDVSQHHIDQLRSWFTEETGVRECSTFDVLAAMIWRSRARAIGLDPRNDCQFGFPVDVRRLFGHILPSKGRGYYGNCVFNMNVVAPIQSITGAPISKVVSLIKEAKERATCEFARWVTGELEGDPHEKTNRYESVVVTDLRVQGFYEDYGWGRPLFTETYTRSDNQPSCAIMLAPIPKTGARILTRCVRKDDLEIFRDEMTGLLLKSILSARL